jgi:hypothetical protein
VEFREECTAEAGVTIDAFSGNFGTLVHNCSDEIFITSNNFNQKHNFNSCLYCTYNLENTTSDFYVQMSVEKAKISVSSGAKPIRGSFCLHCQKDCILDTLSI